MKSILIDNVLKSDFKSKAELQGFDTFDIETVQKLKDAEKFLMNKSLTQELSDEENIQLEICKAEISTLSVAQVVNDESLKKEHIFYRHNDLEKGGHKYFKREGTPGKYKYYYTEAQYKKEKGESGEKKEDRKVADQRERGKRNSDMLVWGNVLDGIKKNDKDSYHKLSEIKSLFGQGKFKEAFSLTNNLDTYQREMIPPRLYKHMGGKLTPEGEKKLKDSDPPKGENKENK